MRPRSVGFEDLLDLRLNLVLALVASDGDFLDDQSPGRLEHAALTERQRLLGLEPVEVTHDLRDVEDGSGLDLVHEPAIAPVPGLVVERDGALPKDRENLLYLFLADRRPEADVPCIVDRHHDLAIRVENPEHVELLAL